MSLRGLQTGLALLMFITSDIYALINYLSFNHWLWIGISILSLLQLRRTKPDVPRPIKVDSTVKLFIPDIICEDIVETKDEHQLELQHVVPFLSGLSVLPDHLFDHVRLPDGRCCRRNTVGKHIGARDSPQRCSGVLYLC